ncbi:MAG TPA: lipopolysaccharide biosynthesis protein [Fibrobacteria bacterium]|nr:lipopolysaccharide biosynthesis protein [Fibrobacteria bacterium]
MPAPQNHKPDAAATAKSAEHHRDFINKGSRFMFLDNVSKVAEPLLVLFCAKAYAGGDWGIFKYYESLILLLTRLGALGLDRGIVWIYARCADDSAFVRRFSRAVNLVFLLSLAVFFFVLMQHLGYLPAIGSWTDKLPKAPPVQLVLFLASVPVQACALIFLQSLINKRVLYFGLLIKNLLVPAAIYAPALLLAFTPWKTVGLALPYLFGNLLGLLLSVHGFLRYYRVSWKDWAFSAFPSRELLRFSLPLASTDFFMSFAYRFDMLLLGRFSGIHEVEIYSVIVMVSNTLRSLRQSFDGIMLSVFSAGGATREIGEPQARNFNYASWLVTSVQIPFFFLALFFGRQLLSLIAPVYGDGYRVLAIATFFGLLTTVGAFSGQLLVGMGKTFMIPVSQVIFFVVSTLLNFLMVPRYGAEGAAFATGLSIFIGGLACFAGIWYYAGSPILQAAYLMPLAAGSAIYAGAATIHFLRPLPLPTDIALFAAASALFAWHARHHWKKFNGRAP